MKADWDKLMADFEDSASALVADVDCTAGGKSLCQQVGVRGYPTIKHGDPNDLLDYKGGRDFASLKNFADGLGPQCSPANLDLCDEFRRAQIKEFMDMTSEIREREIINQEEKIELVEKDFKALLEDLQKQYGAASEKKEKDVEAIKTSGLGLLKAVIAHVKKTGNTEL